MGEEIKTPPPPSLQLQPRRSWVDAGQALQNRATVMRNILINLVAILAIVLSLPIIVRELFASRVTIQPISVPASIERTGLNGTVVSNRLWDAWSSINAKVATAKQTRDVLPSSQRIVFSIPDSGLSFDSLIHHIRTFFGLPEAVLSGELVCVADPCSIRETSLRLRVIGKGLDIVKLDPVGNQPLDEYWRKATIEVMLQVDPVRGILATSLGNEERAIAELRKIYRAKGPDQLWALSYAGVLLNNTGDFVGSRESFDRALEIDPQFALAIQQKANMELNAGNPDVARSLILQALQLAPDDAKSHIQLGLIEDHERHWDAAITAYQHAAVIQPNWPQVPTGMGVVEMHRADLPAAKIAFSKAIEIDPDFVDARAMLANLAALDKNYNEAVRHQQVIVNLSPNDAAEESKLGDFLQYGGKLTPALEHYQHAAMLVPDKARYVERQGEVQHLLNKPDAALQAFEKAKMLDPTFPDIWFQIADLNREIGQTDAAKKAFETYISVQPQGLYVAIAKARIAGQQ